mmetsp:Transcript_16058/g.28845  ORF Transcript_16058/g.28845 Transcript_16058/m.28845 type:complete len:428 (+) Transcript_16058:1-1284(+)
MRLFFNKMMELGQGPTRRQGNSVIQVFYNAMRRYGFLEMRDLDEALQAMDLDGIIFKGVSIKVGRPANFNTDLFNRMRGGKPPPPRLNLGGHTNVAPDFGPTRLHLAGIPQQLQEVHLREILEAFGPLQGMLYRNEDLKPGEPATALCLYKDTSINEVAIKGLNGLKVINGTLAIRPAVPGQDFPAVPVNQPMLTITPGMGLQNTVPFNPKSVARPIGHGAPGTPLQQSMRLPLQKEEKKKEYTEAILKNEAMYTPTNVLVLLNMVTREELKDAEEYNDILVDIEEECNKFGTLKKVLIPRPGYGIQGVGKVFVEYDKVEDAEAALEKLRGRRFAQNIVDGGFWPIDQWENYELNRLEERHYNKIKRRKSKKAALAESKEKAANASSIAAGVTANIIGSAAASRAASVPIADNATAVPVPDAAPVAL